MLFLSGVIVSQAQNSNTNPTWKQTAPDDVIEVEGSEVTFKMMNVCYDDMLFGFSQTSNFPSHIIGSWDLMQPGIIDSSLTTEKLTGLRGYIGNSFDLYYTGEDSFYHSDYVFSSFPFQPHAQSSASMFIPDVLTLIGEAGNLWVLCAAADSINLISVKRVSNQFELTDTIPLSIKEIISVENHNIYSYNPFQHIVGKDINGNLHYYRFNIQGNITHDYILNAFQHIVLYVGGTDTKSILLFKNGNELFVTEYQLASQSISTQSLGTYDEIVSVSKWDYTSIPNGEIAVLVKNNNEPIVKLFNINTWANISNHVLPVAGEKIYPIYGWSGISGYIQYTDTSGNIYLARIASDFSIDNNTIFQLSVRPSVYLAASICFVGIGKKTFPEIKTYLYPNPATEQVTVVVKNVPCDMKHHLELYDMKGKKLYSTPFFSKCDLTIPLHDLSSGMYSLQLHINRKVYTRKLMKK
jgi:hypothetical protein